MRRTKITLPTIFAAALCLFGTLPVFGSQVIDRFYGYYANDDVSGNADHTNVTHIWAGHSTRAQAESHIFSQLALARSRGIKAIVSVDHFVFDFSPDSYKIDRSQGLNWNTLANRLVFEGYLVPGNPTASTVVAFYPVDEPDIHGLGDVGGSPHPALANALSTIRAHHLTSNVPIMAVITRRYARMPQGMKLYDLVGLDQYELSAEQYIQKHNIFQTFMAPGQKSFLVPQVGKGGILDGIPHQPEPILEEFRNDSRVVGVLGFIWRHHQTTGLKEIPDLRARYTALGRYIGKGGPLPLYAHASCLQDGGGLFTCRGTINTISSGVPPYSWDWFGPTIFEDGSFAEYHFSWCNNNYVTMGGEVTDSAGSTASFSVVRRCNGSSEPR